MSTSQIVDVGGRPMRSLAAVTGPGARSAPAINRRSTAESYSIDELVRQLSVDYSGLRISPRKAMHVTAVAACVRVLSTGISNLPLHLYERLDDQGNKRRADDHSLWKPLTFAANSYQHARQFRLKMTYEAVLEGNAYAYINRVGDRVISMVPFESPSVQVRQLDDWDLEYQVTVRNGTRRTLKSSEVLHLRGPYPTGYLSESPVNLCRDAVAFCLIAERYANDHFKSGSRASGGFAMPADTSISDAAFERLSRELKDSVASHEPPLLEGGVEWFSMLTSAKESQLLELRSFQVSEIARMFGVQPHLIASLERSTNNNIEHQSREFVQHSLAYWINEWESAIALQLLGDQAETYFAEFNVDSLLRGDSKSRGEFLSKMVGGPVYTPNEGRRKENLPPVDGGDTLHSPVNMTDIAESGTSSAIEEGGDT